MPEDGKGCRPVAGRAHTDYGFHLAPMTVEQVEEIPGLVTGRGVTSFKYYMFYKGFDLAADSRGARAYTMGDEYDLGHLYLIMERLARTRREHPGLRLSLHCEQPELMRVFVDRDRRGGGPQNLRAYSQARPPPTEQVAVAEAAAPAAHTGVQVNFLHLLNGRPGRGAGSRRAGRAARAESDHYHRVRWTNN
ncbi:hypothetical protein [Nonomuraea longicatena]|uniref:Uncharacterized protein n=1 Tax=Nonomuraea longicatena TaxID=83682 RepID=A0ABP4AHR2_9ACTN